MHWLRKECAIIQVFSIWKEVLLRKAKEEMWVREGGDREKGRERKGQREGIKDKFALI